jgi:hypothetical protein
VARKNKTKEGEERIEERICKATTNKERVDERRSAKTN